MIISEAAVHGVGKYGEVLFISIGIIKYLVYLVFLINTKGNMSTNTDHYSPYEFTASLL